MSQRASDRNTKRSLNREGQFTQELINQLSPQKQAFIHTVFKTFEPHSEQASTLKAWLRAIEQTAFRASLLICSDPNLVLMLIKGLSNLSGETKETRCERLSLFSVSPSYLALRDRFGISWGA